MNIRCFFKGEGFLCFLSIEMKKTNEEGFEIGFNGNEEDEQGEIGDDLMF